MSDVGVPSKQGIFLTLTSDSNCRGNSLVVTNHLKQTNKQVK